MSPASQVNRPLVDDVVAVHDVHPLVQRNRRKIETLVACERIIRLKDGHIVENGSHNELMELNGLYAELFSIQASAFLDEDLEQSEEMPQPVE